ncbi:sigma factor [Streptomyces sp. 549]|uniref:RNA polymerase sigma factor n=1 Tax=Streptomyces sp. 549 TaxID=3049076 RepID=UPI0024C34C07|nr:sigma factor [Streptomyces sp. 549]MDK1477011.1 sigma factor [Streptomyces sp. 549]
MTDRIDTQPLDAATADRLDRLFRLYNRRVVALARTLANHADDADDIASDTWFVAARWVNTLQADDDQAMGWLATLTRHAVRDFYKPRRNRELAYDWSDTLSSFALPTTPAAEDVALAEPMPELPPHLATLVDRLPEQYRTVVRLRCEGVPHSAINDYIGRRAASSSRFHTALRTLRPELEGRPPLPMRPTPHERDGRQPAPQPARPHSRASVALAG